MQRWGDILKTSDSSSKNKLLNIYSSSCYFKPTSIIWAQNHWDINKFYCVRQNIVILTKFDNSQLPTGKHKDRKTLSAIRKQFHTFPEPRSFLKTRTSRRTGLSTVTCLHYYDIFHPCGNNKLEGQSWKPVLNPPTCTAHRRNNILKPEQKVFHPFFYHFINASGNWKITLFTIVYSEARGGKTTEDDEEDYKGITMHLSSRRWRKKKRENVLFAFYTQMQNWIFLLILGL